MLGAWQIGDVEMLHKYYADDVTVVSGAWEPPLVGWANYLRAYQSQRERMTAGRLDRNNTRSEEHTSELQSLRQLVCRLLLEKKKTRSPRRKAPTEGAPRNTLRRC